MKKPEKVEEKPKLTEKLVDTIKHDETKHKLEEDLTKTGERNFLKILEFFK